MGSLVRMRTSGSCIEKKLEGFQRSYDWRSFKVPAWDVPPYNP